jgi:thiamine pyrophosphate-dependent acetolactate synthase large subunit-like protein
MTTLADVFSDGVPLVVFTGQVSTTVLGADMFQEG